MTGPGIGIVIVMRGRRSASLQARPDGGLVGAGISASGLPGLHSNVMYYIALYDDLLEHGLYYDLLEHNRIR